MLPASPGLAPGDGVLRRAKAGRFRFHLRDSGSAMAYIHPAFEAHQRKRFMRPDAARWLREDARRCKAGSHSSFAAGASRRQTQSPDKCEIHSSSASQTIADLHRVRLELLSLRSALIGLRLQRLLRKALPPDGGVSATGPLHYLAQPRVPRGNPDGGRWTLVAGGGSVGRPRGALANSDFPGSTPGQQQLLLNATTRTENAISQIRQYEPGWQPRTQSVTAPGSIVGAIEDANARALEAENYLNKIQSRVGGISTSPFEIPQSPVLPTASRAFDGQGWINAYRTINNMPDLFGRPSWPSDRGTVAVARIDGDIFFGVNSGAPTYTSTNYSDAVSFRDTLIEKYSDIVEGRNIGQAPNDALFHAEASVLLNAARNRGGTLAGKGHRDLYRSGRLRCELSISLAGNRV